MDQEVVLSETGLPKTTVDLVNEDKIEAIVVIIPETREDSNPLETVVVIDSDGESVVKNSEMELRQDMEKMNMKSKMLGNVTPKGGIGFVAELNGERVCRICHLGSNQASQLVQLGCHCKHELGMAHTHCAEAWFKLKGNRMCEICAEIAKNVEGVGDTRFMEEWNEGRSVDSNGDISIRGWGCWRGQPFCNFLMACLVIAFVLPWFLRVNIF